MAKISALIVDDEQLARDELSYLLKAFPEIEVAGQGKNGVEAVSMIRELNPQIVFLDVQMPGLDAFGVIKKLIEKKIPLPAFIFATAYDQYAVHAFEVNALDYLLKPISHSRLEKAVSKARRAIEAHGPPAGKLDKLVDSEDLIYATIEDGVISIITRDLEGQSNFRTVEELQSSLDPQIFWRVHRSFLININRVKEVVPWFKSSFQLKMDDRKQTEIPVSRAQTRKLREILNL
jgi:two-component system response regulator LytT